MKKALLIQPGAFGDIFICAPIAKWYADQGYEVHWPVTQKFIPQLESFDYVTPILLREEPLHQDWLKSDTLKALELQEGYDKVINLSDRGPHPTAQLGGEKFDVCKYRVAGVPIDQKRNLVWSRNKTKEEDLYRKLELDTFKEDYVVAALKSSRGDYTPVPKEETRKIVEIILIEGFNIVDWYKVILNSKAIFAVESAVQCFIEGCGDKLPQKKYLLKRSTISGNQTYTHSPSWDLKNF